MTKKSNYLLSLFGALLLASPIQAQNLLPKPQQVTMGKGVFKTSDGVKVENQVGADAENIYTKAWNVKVNDAAKRVVKFTKLANASSPEAYKLHADLRPLKSVQPAARVSFVPGRLWSSLLPRRASHAATSWMHLPTSGVA